MKLLALVLFLVTAGSPVGSLTPSVTCEAEVQYSYALYLPSNYDPERTWPLILAFDPSGVGVQPVEGFQAAAERYGYIVAGSNDSRNYTGWEFKLGAAAAVWRDVSERFSIDSRRVYTAGFSGGARMATEVALRTGAVAGVFAVGGSFREREAIDGPIPFVFAGASGTRDMNHREMQQAHERLLDRGQPARHLIFVGSHQWPPQEIFTAAVEWFELQALRRELRPRDPAHLSFLYESAVRAARLLPDYEQIARDFDGLIDMTDVESAIERLRGDPATRRSEKVNQRWIRHEDSARARLAGQMRKIEAAVDDAPRRAAGLRELRRELERHTRDVGSEDKNRADTSSRLTTFVSTVGFERAIVASKNGDYERAALFYEIALQAAPDSRGLRVLWAGMYTRLNRFDRALETISEAIALGFADVERLRTDEHLQALRDDPRFAALLAGLESD